MPITHAKVSGKSDGADATQVQPSDWNDEHVGSGGGLPPQWTDGGNGDVTATTDDGSTPITIVGTFATGATAFAGANNDLAFVAVYLGVSGNGTEIDFYNDGTNQSLSIVPVLHNKTVEVHLATNGGGASTSTAAAVLAAIMGDADALTLVTPTLAPGNDGSGVIPTAAFDFIVLAGGLGTNAIEATGSVTITQTDDAIPGLRVVGPISLGQPDVLKVETSDGDTMLRVWQPSPTSTAIDTGSSSLTVKSPSGMAVAAGADPMTVDILDVDDFTDITQSGFDKSGYIFTNRITAPADGDLDEDTHRLFFWFDNTNGAAALKIKGKSADGTVVTATVPLT